MRLVGTIFASLVVATQSVTGDVFDGSYNDPNHPGCARSIAVAANVGKVFGADAAGGEGVACDGKTDIPWGPLAATIQQSTSSEPTIVVDFSPKGGPKNLLGRWDPTDSAIQWADGNNWTKRS